MKLISNNAKEINFISTLINNSITTLDWINYSENKLEIFLNRFCWDLKVENNENFRVNSILFFNNVDDFILNNPPKNKNSLKSIITCLQESTDTIRMLLTDSFELIIKGENVHFHLEDVTEKWPTDTVNIINFKSDKG